MAHLIAPILVEGVELCCDPVTRHTPAVLLGSATELGPDEWEVFRATAYGDPASNPQALSTEVVQGRVVLGVCCAANVQLEVWGRIETLNDGFDWLLVRLNGEEVFFHDSVSTTTDPWDTTAVGPFTINLALEDRACGHIIEIEGSTGDTTANNNVWWKAKVAAIG